METLFSIKNALPTFCSVENFQIDEDGKLQSINIESEDALTKEIIGNLIDVLDNNLKDDYRFNGNFSNDKIRVRVT